MFKICDCNVNHIFCKNFRISFSKFCAIWKFRNIFFFQTNKMRVVWTEYDISWKYVLLIIEIHQHNIFKLNDGAFLIWISIKLLIIYKLTGKLIFYKKNFLFFHVSFNNDCKRMNESYECRVKYVKSQRYAIDKPV